MRVLIGLAFALLVCADPARAATLYVNNSGSPACSDATAKASNSAGSPWCTIGRASWGNASRGSMSAGEAAAAGDTVVITTGTYSYSATQCTTSGTASPTTCRFTLVYVTVNQGTAGNPITFTTSGGTVTLQAPSWFGPVIGCDDRDYIVWSGAFHLDEASIAIHADTGPVTMNAATGCGVVGVTLDGDGDPGYVDNHAGIYWNTCVSCYANNNTLYQFRHPSANHNGSCFMLYDSQNTVIEHNYCYDSDGGLYVKGQAGVTAQSGTIARFNLFRNILAEGLTTLASLDGRFYQNVFNGVGFCVNFIYNGPESKNHPIGDWFYNNTCYNATSAGVTAAGSETNFAENVRLWNNIIHTAPWMVNRDAAWPNLSANVISFQHNAYYGFTNFGSTGSSFPFATWTGATYDQDDVAPVSLSTSDPLFVNAAGGDFKLQGGSPVVALGVDSLDLDGDSSTTDNIPAGAYVTGAECIGLEATCGSSVPKIRMRLRGNNLFNHFKERYDEIRDHVRLDLGLVFTSLRAGARAEYRAR